MYGKCLAYLEDDDTLSPHVSPSQRFLHTFLDGGGGGGGDGGPRDGLRRRILGRGGEGARARPGGGVRGGRGHRWGLDST